MKQQFFFISVSLAFCFISCSQTKKEIVSIGAKQFVVTTMEKGKPETSTQEQMVFTDSLFDNLQCHEWGFTAAKYTATKTGENYNFEATMPGEKEGKMIWKGMVMGDYVHGEMVWKKEGQADVYYTFEGNAGKLPEKKEISLDGKIYFTNTMVHGKPETAYDEDWTFDAGTLRSPSCEEYGFYKSPYKAWQQNGVITMESLFNSEKEGHMNFTATIKGENLTGNVVWHKEGQGDMIYDVAGTLKK
ncbi:MAG: hypothetical protein H7Y00_01025 [Fimbriimonadaceae bacterium]|nr:hypothetical protein [Chitinophagales bacterium]